MTMLVMMRLLNDECKTTINNSKGILQNVPTKPNGGHNEHWTSMDDGGRKKAQYGPSDQLAAHHPDQDKGSKGRQGLGPVIAKRHVGAWRAKAQRQAHDAHQVSRKVRCQVQSLAEEGQGARQVCPSDFRPRERS